MFRMLGMRLPTHLPAKVMRGCRQSQRPLHASAPARRGVRAAAIRLSDHATYLEEVACTSAPEQLPALMRVLSAKGGSPVAPSDRHRLHPFLVPLANVSAAALGGDHGASLIGDELVVCLLRWPDPAAHKAMPLPLVSMSRGARSVRLLARSVDEYLHRLLAEEDVAAGPRPLAEAAGPEAQAIYAPGGVAASGFAGKMPLYLIRKAGMFEDVCEGLAAGHLARGDHTSALVASEWYMRNGHFPGWARPYEYASELFTALKRGEEGRDMARFALRLPWWSLRKPFAELQAMSSIKGTPSEVRFALSEEGSSSGDLSKMNYREARPPELVAADNAARLLDLVAAGEIDSYERITGQLADYYREAGMTDAANFIATFAG